MSELTLKRGMPANVDAERTILGSVLIDPIFFLEAAEQLKPEDFYLDSHRKIFLRMIELSEAGRAIDIVTLSEQLAAKKQLEAINGVAYLSSLTEGLPRRPSIENYCRIVREKSLLRALIHISNTAIAAATEQSEDAGEIFSRAEQQLFDAGERRMQRGFSSIVDIIRDDFGSIDKMYDPDRRITGLRMHFGRLDEMTCGLQEQDLVIVASRPSMGKTAFAMNVAEHAATREAKRVAVFSVEMSKKALLLRMACSRARIDSHKMRQGFLGKQEVLRFAKAAEELAEAPIHIDDTPGISLGDLRAKARRLKHELGGLDLVIVDYLQLMSAVKADGRSYENRTNEVSAISRGLKAIAKELRVPLMALSQLSRATETRGDHRPVLSDLRDSGTIEQDADVVMFIFREEVYDKQRPELEGVAEILVAKQRNGPVGDVRMAFLRRSTTFAELAEGGERPLQTSAGEARP